MEVVGQEHAK